MSQFAQSIALRPVEGFLEHFEQSFLKNQTFFNTSYAFWYLQKV